MIPKKYWCFISHHWNGGMFDCVGSENAIEKAVALIRNHEQYNDLIECHIWDIYQDKCLMNETHIAKYILTPFKALDNE